MSLTIPATPATPPLPRRPAGAALSEALTLVGRCIRLSRRDVETLLMSIALPLMMMVLFVYVFGGAIDTGTAYVNYVVPGIVLLCVGFGAASTATAVADDMTRGMVDRLRSMPVTGAAFLTGHVVASVARNALATAIVFGAAVAMGFRPDAGVLEWAGVVGILLLYVLALSWLAAGLGSVASSVQSASALSFFMLFLPYLSSAFVPTDTMPRWLAAVSEHQPITPVIETVRGLLTGSPVGSTGLIALAWSVGLLLAAFVLAVALFRNRTRR
jgi:ABC-2 type transport system permease protein